MNIVTYWVLPSLITFILLFASYYKEEKNIDIGVRGFEFMIFLSILYPFGLIVLFIVDVWPFFTRAVKRF